MSRKRRKRKDAWWADLLELLARAGLLAWLAGYLLKDSLYYVLGTLALALSVAIPLVRRMLEEERLARAGLPEIDRFTGSEFERWLTLLFRSLGYRAKRTPDQGDWGADIILEASDGQRIAVQAKRWQGSVGVEAVQQVVAARAHYRCDKAMVVTNSYFTPQAIELARSNGVELWDRDRLVQMILKSGTSPARLARSSTRT